MAGKKIVVNYIVLDVKLLHGDRNESRETANEKAKIDQEKGFINNLMQQWERGLRIIK